MTWPGETPEEFELRQTCKAKVDTLFNEVAKRNREPDEGAARAVYAARVKGLKEELVLWLQWNDDL